MSVVIDNLKKLKMQSGETSVPPGMINLVPKRKKKGPSKLLLMLLGLASAGFAMTFFLETGSSKYKAAPPVRETAKSHTVTAKPVETPAPVLPINAKPEQSVKSQVVEKSAQNSTDIQALIDVAVKEALAKAEAERAEKQTSIQALPKQGESGEQVVTLPAVTLERKTNAVLLAETSAASNNALPDVQQVKSVEKPKLTSKQRKEFDAKIQYNTLIALADRSLSSGSYAKAAAGYAEALQKNTEPAVVLNYIKAAAGLGDIAQVKSIMRKYHSIMTDDIVTSAALSISNAGYTEDSIAVLGSYVGSFEKDNKIYYTAGMIHEHSRNYKKAAKAYETAKKIVPSDILYAYAYARMLDTEKKYSEAVEEYINITGMSGDAKIKANAESRARVLINYLAKVKEAERKTASERPE